MTGKQQGPHSLIRGAAVLMRGNAVFIDAYRGLYRTYLFSAE
jgi:hypothetical protein